MAKLHKANCKGCKLCGGGRETIDKVDDTPVVDDEEKPKTKPKSRERSKAKIKT